MSVAEVVLVLYLGVLGILSLNGAHRAWMVAVWLSRATSRMSVSFQTRVTGLKSWAHCRASSPSSVFSSPPATSTLPFGRRVAAWSDRASLRRPTV